MPTVIREPKSAPRVRQREIVKTLSRHGLAFLVDRVHARDASPSRPEHVTQLQKAYGAALVQNRYGSYDVGNLLFSTSDSTPSTKVSAVGLYNSKAPRANQNFGAQPYTSYTIGNLLPACS